MYKKLSVTTTKHQANQNNTNAMCPVVRFFFGRSFDDSYGDYPILEKSVAKFNRRGDEYVELALPVAAEDFESTFRKLRKRGFWESDIRMFCVSFFVRVQVARTSDAKPVFDSEFYCDSSEAKVQEHLAYLLEAVNKLALVLTDQPLPEPLVHDVDPVLVLTGCHDGDYDAVREWLDAEGSDQALTERLHDYYDTSAWREGDHVHVWLRRYLWQAGGLKLVKIEE